MLKKITAAFLALAVVCAFALPMTDNVCDAKGGRAGGYSRSAAPKVSAHKASAPKAFAPKGNTGGYKSKSSAPAASSKGSTTTTNGGGKVTSAGGNTSGYKSKQTQNKEKAVENVAKKDTSSSSNKWYGGTNNHYYGGSGYDGGIGHFATGMVFGSLLSSPWHVYAGAPGYVGSYGGAPGVAPTGGFYSPLSGLLGVVVWLIEWTIVIGILIAAWLVLRKWWRNSKKK